MIHGVAALLVLGMVAQADIDVGHGPEPAPQPIGWELEFRFLDPQRMEIQLPGTGQTETYWYMVYTVVNDSGRSRRFFPTFELVTEDLDVIQTDVGISALVFDAIRERHKITHPYLVHPTKAIGALLTGEDNARESVAIWRDVPPDVNRFRVYVEGLSGETRLLKNPMYDANEPEAAEVIGPDGQPRELTTNPKFFTLRKTLEIRYTLPGSPDTRAVATPERRGARWIMR